MSLPTRQQALSTTFTAVAYAVAIVYVLGQRLGRAYYANQETIHSDLATFKEAVVTGSRNAIGTTFAVALTSRAAFDTYYPVVKPRALALYARSRVWHNEVSDYLRGRFATA